MREPCGRRKPWIEVGNRDLRTHMRMHAIPLCAGMESRSPIDAVAIQQRHGRHLQLDRPLDKFFGLRRTFKETESAPSMQLNIPLSPRTLLRSEERRVG